MKRVWKGMLALCLVLTLSACGPKESSPSMSNGGSTSQPPSASSQEDVSSSAPEEVPQIPDGSQEEPASPPLTADYAPEELLSQEGTYDYFEADSGEFQVKLVFTARETVTDLKYVTLNLDYYDENGELQTGVGDTLYTQEELTPDRPLVVGMVFYGDVASRGFTFVDGQGQFHCVSINMSGEDGSILLVEEELPAP